MKPFLITVVGPTASGKTDLAIQLAQHYHTEIISADSRQLFKELTIGTAKATAEELALASHHFINHVSITQDYSAGQYERDALQVLDNIYKTHPTAILAGGTGLYINALLKGFDDLPPVDMELRNELNRLLAEKGISHLQMLLLEHDPAHFTGMDFENPQRLVRALEITMGTGKPNSFFRTGQTKQRPFQIIQIGLYPGKEQLHERIAKRVDKMMEHGLLDEVRSLLPYRDKNALQTVGYTEMFKHLDGEITLERAIELVKQNTRRYAKRQMTWFRRQEDIVWFDGTNLAAIIAHIETQMKA